MVYFMRVAGTDYVKIGYATNIKSRLSCIQVAHYEVIELCLTIDSDLDDYLERKLHEHFKDCHVRGEWFKIPITAIVELLQTPQFAPRAWDDRYQYQHVTEHSHTVENFIPNEIDFLSCKKGMTKRPFTQDELNATFRQRP